MNDQSDNNLSSTSDGSEHHPTQHSDAPHAADIPDSQLQDKHSTDTVSYTHLTLPTSDLV